MDGPVVSTVRSVACSHGTWPAAGFDGLVARVRGGHRPAGDAILNRHEVAEPTFGCRFTDGVHPEFVPAPCPG